jgi:hypothetical protein
VTDQPPAPAETPTEETEGEPSDLPADEPTEEQKPANFHEKYTYRDGLQVRVIRIKLGHFTKALAEALGKISKSRQARTERVSVQPLGDRGSV